MKIRVGLRDFDSKAAAVAECRRILYACPLHGTVPAPDSQFLLDLLKGHRHAEQKIGAGVRSFQVRPDGYGKRCFWLTRTDGSQTDFSFIHCLTRTEPRNDALSALRTAIRPQVVAFRASRPAVCAVTGTRLAANDVHVDHVTPFVELVQNFLDELGMTIDQIPVTPTADGSTKVTLADPEIERAWVTYHAEYATLRIVHRTVNLSTLRKSAERRAYK